MGSVSSSSQAPSTSSPDCSANCHSPRPRTDWQRDARPSGPRHRIGPRDLLAVHSGRATVTPLCREERRGTSGASRSRPLRTGSGRPYPGWPLASQSTNTSFAIASSLPLALTATRTLPAYDPMVRTRRLLHELSLHRRTRRCGCSGMPSWSTRSMRHVGLARPPLSRQPARVPGCSTTGGAP